MRLKSRRCLRALRSSIRQPATPGSGAGRLLAVRYCWIDERRADQCAGGLAVVVEGVSGGVVRVIPRAGGDSVPPSVAVLDGEADDSAGDGDCHAGRNVRALDAAAICVVGPRMRDAPSGFRIRLPPRGRGRRSGCRWGGLRRRRGGQQARRSLRGYQLRESPRPGNARQARLGLWRRRSLSRSRRRSLVWSCGRSRYPRREQHATTSSAGWRPRTVARCIRRTPSSRRCLWGIGSEKKDSVR
jgi:hypothetical protein